MITQPAAISNQTIDIMEDVFSISGNNTQNKYIDILEKKFNIANARDLFRYKVGISKDAVKTFLKNNFKKNNFNKIYLSSDLVKVLEIKDLYDKQVFSYDIDGNGWFIFIDKCIVANWSHDCEYIFLLNEDAESQFHSKHIWPPKNNIEMEEIL